jgi:RimJ/RimL family protein N-acetyltransferase
LTEHSEENIKYVIPGTADWHRKALQNSDMIHFIAEDEDGKNIGLVILAGLEDPDDCLELMRLIVNEKGKGYGRKILKEIKSFAFEECKAHRLWLDVKDYNERAISLYKSEGFSDFRR